MLESIKGLFSKVGGWLSELGGSIISTITGLWDKIVKAVNDFAAWLWSVVVYVGGVLWDFFFHEESGLVWWLCGLFLDLGAWFIEKLPDFSGLVGQYAQYFGPTLEVCARANKLFPLKESLTLLGIFITFVILFLGAKLIMKLLPSVG